MLLFRVCFFSGPQPYESVIKVTIAFNGTCEADNAQFEKKFIGDLMQKLKQYPVCSTEVCSRINGKVSLSYKCLRTISCHFVMAN